MQISNLLRKALCINTAAAMLAGLRWIAAADRRAGHDTSWCQSLIKSATHLRFLGLTLALVAALYDGASAEPKPLVGEMASWQRIVGYWICNVTIEPGNGQFPQKGFTFAEGAVLPGNVFHWSDRASGFAADQYDGYSDAKKAWWESQASSAGYGMILQSSDGLTYDQISLPTSLEDGRGRYREVYSLRPDGSFYQVVERRIAGSWHIDSIANCKRTGSIPRT
jgi:hypothetical protein